MKKVIKISLWIFMLLTCLGCFTYGFSIGAVLLTALTVFASPFDPIMSFRHKLLKWAWLRYTAIFIFMGIFINLCPLPEQETQEPQQQIEATVETKTSTAAEAVKTSAQAASVTELQASAAETTAIEITTEATASVSSTPVISYADIPAYNGNPYVAVNGNQPYFTNSDLTTSSFERYSELDGLGRCGAAYACIGIDLMPTEKRGSIGSVKPSGWQTVKYDNVDGKYLYNRCHLIGYQLSGENANTRNLITGTRYLNIQGMLPFENMVADYVKETNNHTLYRVTPVFSGNNLVADGVFIEGYSVEDNGAGICFNVFAYNVQPGISIDYSTGNSSLAQQSAQPAAQQPVNRNTAAQVQQEPTAGKTSTAAEYVLNTNTKKFHYPSCSSVSRMSEKNKKIFNGTRETVISQGYEPCKNCNP